MVQTIGFWLTFTRCSLAALEKLSPNLKPIPLAFGPRKGGGFHKIFERPGTVVRLDWIFTSERVPITISMLYIRLMLPNIYFLYFQFPPYTYTLYFLVILYRLGLIIKLIHSDWLSHLLFSLLYKTPNHTANV